MPLCHLMSRLLWTVWLPVRPLPTEEVKVGTWGAPAQAQFIPQALIGDLDLTSADYTPHNMLYLFENDRRGIFRRHVIQKDDPERLERHMVGDVDGDHDLDVVIVCVPTCAHFSLTEFLIGHDLDVLVEKPLGTNAQECEHLVRVVEKTGLTLQVGSMKRHDPGMAFANRFVQEHLDRSSSL